MKRCSKSEKCKSATMSYHLTPVRMTVIKKSIKSRYQRGCGEKGTLQHCWWEYRWCCHYGEQHGGSLKNYIENSLAVQWLELCTFAAGGSGSSIPGGYVGYHKLDGLAKNTNFKKSLNIELPYDPAILLLGIYPEKIII